MFGGSNPTEGDGFQGRQKSVARFPSEGSKAVGPHVVKFYGMFKNHEVYERDALSTKFKAISRQVPPASLLSVSANYCQSSGGRIRND
jgi:hypothetical protein